MSKPKRSDFIPAKTEKDRALQIFAREFLLLSMGAEITTQEAELFFALASLALPMRYRMPRGYKEKLLEEVKRGAARALFDEMEGGNPQ